MVDTANDRRSFYRNYPTVKFSKGEIILHQDEVPKYVYSIKSGVVEETNITRTGCSQSISFEIIGDIFPKDWAFAKTERTLFYYNAYTDCELYVINRDDFLTQLVYNLEFTNKMLRRTANALIGARLQIDSLEKPNASIKLMYMFRCFCLMYGRDIAPNTVELLVPLTQQTIADHVGLTRETASIELNRLKAKGIILSCKQKIYVINTEALAQQIEDEFNPGVYVSMLPKGD